MPEEDIEFIKPFIFMWLSTSPEFDKFLDNDEIKALDHKIFSKYLIKGVFLRNFIVQFHTEAKKIKLTQRNYIFSTEESDCKIYF